MAGAYHACTGARAGARRRVPCSGGSMSRVAIVLTALGLALAGVLVYFFAGRGEQKVVVTLQPGPPQPRVPLGEAGMDPQAIDAAVTYAAARNTRALVVGRGGHIVFEKYW